MTKYNKPFVTVENKRRLDISLYMAGIFKNGLYALDDVQFNSLSIKLNL